jgi:hypothetical protein
VCIVIPVLRAEILHEVELEIPEKIDGYVVTNLGRYALTACDSQKIVVPDSVEVIDAYAFSGCANLQEIDIPDSVTTIKAYAFVNCIALESIKLSENLEAIADGTFERCYSLKEIVLPDSGTKIEEKAFFECNELESIKLSENLEVIAGSTFSHCKNLKEIRLPSDIYYLGDNSLGLLAGTEKFVLVEDFVIYAANGTLGADYAEAQKITLKTLEEYTEPASMPEAEVCVPTGVIREADKPVSQSGSLNSGDVVTIVLSIAGCVVIIGGVAVASYYYEKKRKKLRKEQNQNSKKKKK